MAATDRKTVFLAGGGTGGHLYPAIAIGQELEKRLDCELHFIGTQKGLENRIVPEYGYPLHLLAVRGMARRLALANVLVPFRLIWSLWQSFILLRRYKPMMVIGTGGYVSGPMLFAAAVLGFPTIIQEQNSYPGVTTRWLSRLVDQVHISFKESEKYFSNKSKLNLSGNPIRKFDMNRSPAKARQSFGLQPNRTTMLVFGGSQGARAINKALLASLPTLMDTTDLQIVWSTGKFDVDLVKKAVAAYTDRIWVAEYISDMETAYAAGDFALARAGAISLAELMACGVPAILIPLPWAAANHQQVNARSLEKLGAVGMILQSQLDEKTLLREIENLMRESTRNDMREKTQRAAFPNATRDIVDSILEYVQGGQS